MTVVSNAKTRNRALDTRQVAKVNTGGKDRAKSKHKVKGSDKEPSGLTIHGGYYSPKDFGKLKPFERAEVLRLRKEKDQKKSDTREVSAIVTEAVEVPQTEEEVTTSVAPPKKSCIQFGKYAHGGQKKN
jgi:hypothetical protein